MDEGVMTLPRFSLERIFPKMYEEIARLQEIELGILREFDRVCQDLELNYTICAGTLLGAVRHGGFIPWDDDVDVAMTREDYDKFIHHAQKLLAKNLFIQTYESDPHYLHNFCKIIDSGTHLKERLTRNIPMRSGVYIDVFPIDRVSTNPLKRKLDKALVSLVYFIKVSSNKDWIRKNNNYLKRVPKWIVFPLAKLLGTRRLNRLETYIKSRNNNLKNTHTYGDNYLFPLLNASKFHLLPIEVFTSTESREFEGHFFKASKFWDIYLKSLYGDYMQLPPEAQRVPTHAFLELDLDL